MNIIESREIEPLLTKARHAMKYYKEAMNCTAIVLDKDGSRGRQMRLCELCVNRAPCDTLHNNAQAESRRAESSYIYTCMAGFIFWTSPLYRNGHYAGALTAGQILPKDGKKTIKKFPSRFKDRSAAENFRKILGDIPEKSQEEIESMARLLGVCAEEISGKGTDSCGMFGRGAWFEQEHKTTGIQINPPHNGAEYPLEKERMLFAAFRRGDIETGGRILTDLMNYIRLAIPGNLEVVRFRAIELTVLLSRAAMDPDEAGGDSLLETNTRYLRRIQESKTAEELIKNLHLVAERMAGEIFSFKGIRHASVLRKAERYIWENYSRKISLEEISRASGLSAPYFSTIFKEEMGENLSGYLNRLRAEKAAALLTETGKSLNEIASSCGFDDQSWFSKIFKRYTGVSPGKFRDTGTRSDGHREKGQP